MSLHKLFREDTDRAPRHRRIGQKILLRKEWLDEWLEKSA